MPVPQICTSAQVYSATHCRRGSLRAGCCRRGCPAYSSSTAAAAKRGGPRRQQVCTAPGLSRPSSPTGGGVLAHVTVGDEAHVRVLGADGPEEGQVVVQVHPLAAVLPAGGKHGAAQRSVGWLVAGALYSTPQRHISCKCNASQRAAHSAVHRPSTAHLVANGHEIQDPRLRVAHRRAQRPPLAARAASSRGEAPGQAEAGEAG